MLTEEDFKIYLKRAANYCVYQERTHREVRQRLAEWQVFGDDAEMLIGELISERFISEERYAKAFAGGKFRIKHWGRIKIKYELKGKGISEYNIKTGMKEITDEDYAEKIKYLIERKLKEVRFEEKGIRNLKIAKFLISKGYETDIVWDEIRAMN